MRGLTVIVCGGRDIEDEQGVAAGLDAFEAVHGRIDRLVHGGTSGVDHLTAQWGDISCCEVVAVKAEWKTFGPAAWPMRNQRMLDEYRPDFVIAFPGGRGTDDMVQRAGSAGVSVFRPMPVLEPSA